MTTPDETPAVEPAAEVAATPPPVVPEAAPAAAPAAQYAAASYTPAPAPQAYAAPNPMPSTWMNITSFVTGLLGLAIIPVIFGHMGVSQSNKGRADFKWMGIVGLVLGYLTIVVYVVITAIFVGALIATSN